MSKNSGCGEKECHQTGANVYLFWKGSRLYKVKTKGRGSTLTKWRLRINSKCLKRLIYIFSYIRNFVCLELCVQHWLKVQYIRFLPKVQNSSFPQSVFSSVHTALCPYSPFQPTDSPDVTFPNPGSCWKWKHQSSSWRWRSLLLRRLPVQLWSFETERLIDLRIERAGAVRDRYVHTCCCNCMCRYTHATFVHVHTCFSVTAGDEGWGVGDTHTHTSQFHP